jgi:hypothetical protein
MRKRNEGGKLELEDGLIGRIETTAGDASVSRPAESAATFRAPRGTPC